MEIHKGFDRTFFVTIIDNDRDLPSDIVSDILLSSPNCLTGSEFASLLENALRVLNDCLVCVFFSEFTLLLVKVRLLFVTILGDYHRL